MGAYDNRLSDRTLVVFGPVNTAPNSAMLEACGNLSSEIKYLRTTCGCGTMGHKHSSLFLYARRLERTLCKPQDLPWFTIKNGHHLVLTIRHRAIPCVVVSRERCLRVTTPPTEFRRAVQDSFYSITPQMLRSMSQKTWRHIRLFVLHQGSSKHVTKKCLSDSI